MFDTLRNEAPVHFQRETDGGRGFWAVTRHADICEVDKEPETFTSTDFVNLEEVDDDLQELRRSILETDGTRHRALRKLIPREFSRPNLMRNYEAFLRDLTKATVDAALDEVGVRLRRRRSAPISRSRCWPACSTSPRSTPAR